jgi:hypothetical protein
MLTRNVYIIYPPGYSGSYINWAINISDSDNSAQTIKNPINNNNSSKFGGAGTSHLYHRIPTHQSIMDHMAWMLYNRPTDPRIYIINSHNSYQLDIYNHILEISKFDPTGVFIVIHSNNDRSIQHYGYINCITKWPTFIVAGRALSNNTRLLVPDGVDLFNCGNSIELRNYIAKYDKLIFNGLDPINRDVLNQKIKNYVNWFQIRNSHQPHEVNESTYNLNFDLTNRLFEINCADIVSNKFYDIFYNIMIKSNISDSFDTTYVKDFHINYVNSQPNTQWFTSYDNWKKNRTIDEYILSHSAIQARIIIDIFKNINFDATSYYSGKQEIFYNYKSTVDFYNTIKKPNWPNIEYDHSKFYNLPEFVQNEMIEEHSYHPVYIDNSITSLLKSKWQHLSIIEINELYQNHFRQ